MDSVTTPASLRQLALLRVEYEAEDRYWLTFEDQMDGTMVGARCTVSRVRGKEVASLDPPLFNAWMGDAQSIRSVVTAVVAVNTARRLSLRDYA